MLWTYRKPAIAKLSQIPANAAFMHLDVKIVLQHLLQIYPPPAHHPVQRRIGAFLQQFDQGFAFDFAKRAFVATGAPFAEPGNALLVVMVHPVAQSLPVHAASLRRWTTTRPLKHQSDRQHASHNQRILLFL